MTSQTEITKANYIYITSIAYLYSIGLIFAFKADDYKNGRSYFLNIIYPITLIICGAFILFGKTEEFFKWLEKGEI